MVHHGVHDEHRLDQIGGVDAVLAREFSGKRVDRGPHRAGHFRVAARVHHRVGDAAHQVLAEADLRVHHPGRGLHRTGRQIAKMGGNRRRADVDRQPPERPVEKAGPKIDQPLGRAFDRSVQDRRDLEVALPQHRLQPGHQRERGPLDLDLPLVAEGGAQAFQIARGLVHVGRGDLDINDPRRRIHLHDPFGGRLADHLFVDLTFGRHVDHDVLQDLRLTAEPPPLRQAAHALVARLDRVPFGQRVLCDRHTMFREVTEGRRD